MTAARLFAVAAMISLLAGAVPAQSTHEAALEESEIPRNRSSHHGRPRRRLRGSRIRSTHHLRRLGSGRRFQNRQRRHELGADLRRSAQLHHRRHCHRPVRSFRPLGGNRRAQQSPELVLGGRHFQVAGCGQNLVAHGSQGYPSHRTHGDSSHRSQHCVRRRSRTFVGTQQRARRV